ncbi:MAG: HDIG domain-containing metalloprotein [Candidatus Omnitrophota bacterium]
MKIQLKNDISFLTAGLIILVMILLSLFCQSAKFSLIIPLLLLFSGLHLFFFKKSSLKLLINLGFLLTILIFTAHAFSEYTTIPELYLPVASATMLTMLLFNDLQLAFLMAFLSSTLVCLVLGSDLSTMLIFFIGSLTAAYSVREARTRGQLINAGFYIGGMQVVSAIFLRMDPNFIFTKYFLMNYVRPLFINGFVVAFIIMATSKIFESLFGVLTNFSLLELSDFNHPLLKRMVLEAPGTYHHSLIVSNLSEAAADAIGANSLLTRVGAYYHDIGKMEKPEYFTENQLIDSNKHDNIEPSMSRLVILNHVKEGVELAKKYKLNPIIADFITQHHGTSLIFYFYQKALESATDTDSVAEENFRYPGPKPQTKETAIVMLADSVEGATRSLDEPNPKKIEEVVRKIINNKFIDGQLDECNLTLKEIDRMSTTFTRVLSAMYHSRVKYPEKKDENGNNNQKSAEKSYSEPGSNHPVNGKNPSS